MIGAAPEAFEAALMQHYPGQGNPVLAALQGDISIRQLRVMLDHLPEDNAAARKLVSKWGDQLRILHDISSTLRVINANFYNVNRGNAAPIKAEFLPTPESLEEQADNRSMEQVEEERNHLQAVLARTAPQKSGNTRR